MTENTYTFTRGANSANVVMASSEPTDTYNNFGWPSGSSAISAGTDGVTIRSANGRTFSAKVSQLTQFSDQDDAITQLNSATYLGFSSPGGVGPGNVANGTAQYQMLVWDGSQWIPTGSLLVEIPADKTVLAGSEDVKFIITVPTTSGATPDFALNIDGSVQIGALDASGNQSYLITTGADGAEVQTTNQSSAYPTVKFEVKYNLQDSLSGITNFVPHPTKAFFITRLTYFYEASNGIPIENGTFRIGIDMDGQQILPDTAAFIFPATLSLLSLIVVPPNTHIYAASSGIDTGVGVTQFWYRLIFEGYYATPQTVTP